MSITSEEIIDEILHEASQYGLLVEVIDTAKKILEEQPKLDRVSAFEMALKEWVK
jgi:hypothetical protein